MLLEHWLIGGPNIGLIGPALGTTLLKGIVMDMKKLGAPAALLLILGLSGCAGIAGITRLHMAAYKGDQARVERLISKGADVNAKDAAYSTPLDYAASKGHTTMIKYLLDHGATGTSRAMTFASRNGHQEAVSVLRAHGAEFEGAALTEPRARDASGNDGSASPVAVLRAVSPANSLIETMVGESSPKTAPEPQFAASPAQTAPAEVPQARSNSTPRSSDVDAPSYKLPLRSLDYALIVGVENYSKLPPASYAESDAAAFRKHLEAMGFPPRNIIHLKGQAATRGALQGYVEEWLPKNIKPESTLFFYYSGHGAPDPKTGEAFLVPWDGDAMFLQSTAYPLKRLYSSLAKLKTKEIIIALDSCFSGAGGRSVLAAGTRPLVTKVDEGVVPRGNITLFAAASGDEITGSLDEQGHGMFTYYFLKGLAGAAKNSSGAITAKGLHGYLKPHVQDEASRQNREQTPTLVGQQDRTISQF